MKTAFIALALVASTAHAELIRVPTDAKARYDLLMVKPINGNLLVVTQRSGPSGVTFSAREVNCRNMTFRYLGTGDTMQEMLDNAPFHEKERMGELTPGSISTYVSSYACTK